MRTLPSSTPLGPRLFIAPIWAVLGIDVANCIAVDQSGNAYVTGRTTSVDFPTTPGALQPALSVRKYPLDYAAFVTKVNSDGSQLAYSTFLATFQWGMALR